MRRPAAALLCPVISVAAPPDRSAGPAPGRLRIDKWLWQARFFKTRSLAAARVEKGLRLNGRRVTKPGQAVGPGDVLTFMQGRVPRTVRVLDLGVRRGPAAEAQSLYTDLDAQGRDTVPPEGLEAEHQSRAAHEPDFPGLSCAPRLD